ncbi:secreted protein with C-terminal beta-propeller domain [Halovivax ruber XH-70]|uniref:Secreted protein with C-terminal beta-propeller domain n=1 Tax=Halovivax ruber (strain DSM 18193 / JCM 13892 / XH-70) TaxID=797302 RepID=L0IFL0_HALRX|nr:beta-propeller domain-containing protein [Halovivax ruber]AGB17633.1 secreted protein with C-terminal beta-propeller domain [Halovivax ruber XH-70]
MDETRTTVLAVALVALLVGGALGGAFGTTFTDSPEPTPVRGDQTDWHGDGTSSLAQFDSAAAFESYFAAADRHRFGLSLGAGLDVEMASDDEAMEESDGGGDAGGQADSAGDASGASGGDGRDVSGTNVQEAGIDEPDVLKAEGEAAYYAGHRFRSQSGETTIVDTTDAADPEPVATIPASGELLLVPETDTLVVFDGDRLWGYDVSDPAAPEQVWDQSLEADLETARLVDGDLYLVLVDRPDSGAPCPVAGYGDDVACTDVYRPGVQTDADAVYTAARVDPASGELVDETSVVGSTHSSATYVSENAIYLTYTRSVSEYQVLSGYLTGPGVADLGLDAETVDRIETLDGLNITERAKTVELRTIVERWFASLDEEAHDDAREAFDEGIAAYADDRQRDLTKTGIARVSIDGDLDVTASGEVPGTPLNQWSMDEHDGHLRIATTIPRTHGADSENDVYVLDDALEITGSVEGLGETERIYAVRFEGDEGHVVTFRETDPFYTLDLADPHDPQLEGELKIPGFSTYLHPLDDAGDLMLGVGEQDGKVKLSTFDVSDRTDPVELDAAILSDERYSEAVQNHRAFLHDAEHGAFFVPAGEASYLYSYDDGTLTQEKQIDIGGPGVRAMYVENALYVFGESELIVLERGTWEEVDRHEL